MLDKSRFANTKPQLFLPDKHTNSSTGTRKNSLIVIWKFTWKINKIGTKATNELNITYNIEYVETLSK